MKSTIRKTKSPVIPLYPYQQRWLADESRFKLWVKSVQVGASFAQCVEAVLDCAKSKEKTSTLWILLSASERQALELARTCKQICQAARITAELRENEFFHQTLLSQHRLEFPNGARILALPANPDTARGSPVMWFWMNSPSTATRGKSGGPPLAAPPEATRFGC